MEHRLVAAERLREEAEVGEVEQRRALVEHAHDDLLAVHRRQRRDAEVDLLAGDVRRHASVLRDALLGDVEVGHDLQAADEAGLHLLRRAHHLVQHAVDAVPDAHVVLGRLDVDVGRAVLHALADDEVRQLDDRRVLGDLADVRELLLVVDLVDGEST